MSNFIEKIDIIKLNDLFFYDNPIELCGLSYPNHPKGCPNIGKNKNCPPFADRLEDVYDLDKSYYFCYVKFNIKKQKERMKSLHPEWSDKKCKCLLYWQKSVVKELRICSGVFCAKKNVYSWYYDTPELLFEYKYKLVPEAMGLDVFRTAKHHGIILERNPENYVYKIAFIGVLK